MTSATGRPGPARDAAAPPRASDGQGAPGLAGVRVLATDLDRTFTREDLGIDPQALEAARRLRQAGVRVVLATGRHQGYLDAHAELVSGFDACIAEGGALWRTDSAWQRTVADVVPLRRLQAELAAAGVPFEAGTASVSMAAADEGRLRSLAASGAVDWRRNRDRLDVTPRGVDKGAALRLVLRRWGITPPEAVAVGDGDNDIPMLAAVGHGVAVANAAPALKAMAREVAPLAACGGFTWLADRLLDARAATTGTGAMESPR